MTATTPRRLPRSARIAALVLLAAVVVAVALTIASPPGRQASQPPATEPTTTAPTTPAAPTSPPTVQGLADGIYEVGAEIPAGTYATTAGTRPCYWARLRSFGQPDSIIDDRNLEPGESARVVVKASDRGFKVSNGCTWQRQQAL